MGTFDNLCRRWATWEAGMSGLTLCGMCRSGRFGRGGSRVGLGVAVATGLASIGIAAGGAVADQITLAPVADNTMYSESGDLSNGAGDYLFAGRPNSDDLRRTLFLFDVSAIPPGSVIDSVQLTLYMSRSKNGDDNESLYALLSDWGEGGSDAPLEEGAGAQAEEDDATWVYTFYDAGDPPSSPAWGLPGGDYVGTASATTLVGAVAQYYTWGSTAGMVSDVQMWVDSPAMNAGWILIGNEGAKRTATRFNSRTNPTANTRPQLVINFTPPAGTGACCFGDGSCSILSSSDCSLAGGSYEGDGTSCTPNPCPQPTGAVCFADGSCTDDLTQAEADLLGGFYQGDGTECSGVTCPVLTGAACFNDGSCTDDITEADAIAAGGTFLGNGSLCVNADCPVVLTKYVDPMVAPPLAVPASGSIGGVATYDIDIVQTTQQVHTDLPPTTIWAYNGTWPGPTVVASQGMPVTMNFVNDLRDGGVLRTDHFLDVDLCPHGAEDVAKTITHMHGAHLPSIYDGHPEDAYQPGGSFTHIYPNLQPATLMWYHDHALGITRLNVMMGMAAGYVLRDPVENALGLPSGDYEVPLIIQDRSFNPDGSFKYPAVWGDMFFGDTFVVDGTAWPYFDVDRATYRFRVLNGCNSRTLTFAFSNGMSFDLIGIEGGLRETPLTLTEMTLGPAERADILVDFSGESPGTEILLTNSAGAPYPNGNPANDLPEIMKFVVGSGTGPVVATPGTLATVETLLEGDAEEDREFLLRKMDGTCTGFEWGINDLGWTDITERPQLGTTEVWEFANASGMMHPMHMHLVLFQVLDRDTFTLGPSDEIIPDGNPQPPLPEEAGWKDTVRVGPNELVRVIARFEDFPGLFAYHCHILEHEDHEMMRQFLAEGCKADVTTTNSNPGDTTYGMTDGVANGADLSFYVEWWLGNSHALADMTTTNANPGDPGYGVPDSSINGADLSYYVEQWLNGCP